jgi:ketosteroid isomerase-like protein
MMRKFSMAAVCVLFAVSLVLAADPTTDLKNADQGWAKASQAKNLDQFLSFVGDDIYACGPDGKWVHGKAAMKDEWAKLLADPNFKLTWTLDSAEVSKDGHMGYTRGTFQGSQGDKPFSGAYTTVWKKDKDGKWRVAVDIASLQS